jgi:hypothetical protein
MRIIVMVGLGSLLAVGCGSSSDSVDADTATTYNCAADTRGEVYTPGMAQAGVGMLYDFKLMTATPPPAIVGDGNNEWVVEIDQMANGVVGDPVSGVAADITVTPYMPDHKHGSPIAVEVTAASAPGQYTLNPINLWMPGLWETTITLTQGTTFDKVVFSFCLSS